MRGERLQKVLAHAGFGSRRQCEEIIAAGRVEIDRVPVRELGTRVDPFTQSVRVDGEAVRMPRPLFFAVHKPKGVVCTHRDPQGRARAIDLVPARFGRMFPVGRLDLHSEGLLILTNDGNFANEMMHPRYGVPKTYRVQVAGHPSREVLDTLRRGVHLAEGLVRPAALQVKTRHKNSAFIEVTLTEGRNREIRRMFAKVEHKVMSLVRIAIGPVRLGNLLPGAYRRLTREEIHKLRNLAHQDDEPRGADTRRATPRKKKGSRR